MELNELIQEIFYVCIIPLLGVLTTFITKFLNEKINDLKTKVENETLQKYLALINNTVIKCVKATNQTYTDTLKKLNKFDEAAQKEAFQRTYNAVMNILTDEVKVYINNIVGDINIYIEQLIEAEVGDAKQIKLDKNN